MKRYQQLLLLSTLALIIVLFIILVQIGAPQAIVDTLGEENAYLAIFLIGALGGVSTFTSATYFAVVASFASTQLNIYAIAIAGGLGSAIGDTLVYYLGREGRAVTNKKATAYIQRVRERLEQTNPLYIPLIVFCYAAFTPLPNEFMTIPTGLSGISYKWVLPALILGNITITLLALLLLPTALSWI